MRCPLTCRPAALHAAHTHTHLGTCSSVSRPTAIAIDNKIERAMDLVKGHLMFAVREEVEVLKERLKALWERNSELQRENALLKSLAGLSAPCSPQQVPLAEWIQAVEWTRWVQRVQRAARTPQNDNSAAQIHPTMTSV